MCYQRNISRIILESNHSASENSFEWYYICILNIYTRKCYISKADEGHRAWGLRNKSNCCILCIMHDFNMAIDFRGRIEFDDWFSTSRHVRLSAESQAYLSMYKTSTYKWKCGKIHRRASIFRPHVCLYYEFYG